MRRRQAGRCWQKRGRKIWMCVSPAGAKISPPLKAENNILPFRAGGGISEFDLDAALAHCSG